MTCYDVYSSRTTLYGILHEHFMLIAFLSNPIVCGLVLKIFEKLGLEISDNIISLMLVYVSCIFGIFLLLTIFGAPFFELHKDEKLSEEEKNLLISTYLDDKQKIITSKDQTTSIENNYDKIIKSKCENLLSKIPPELQNRKSVSIKNYIKRSILEDEEILKKIYTDEVNIDEVLDNISVKEEKRIANHISYEGRLNYSDKRKLKKVLGDTCCACGIKMSDIYGDIGNGYIELHHKIPYSEMVENDTRILTQSDFCVLCPNCHKMVHKLDDAGDIELLSSIVKANKDI